MYSFEACHFIPACLSMLAMNDGCSPIVKCQTPVMASAIIVRAAKYWGNNVAGKKVGRTIGTFKELHLHTCR